MVNNIKDVFCIACGTVPQCCYFGSNRGEVTKTMPKEEMQKPKDLPKTAIKMDELVTCPFCEGKTFRIGAKNIECYKCGTQYDKGFVKNGNVYSINMNLTFLKDLWDAGIDEGKLGITVINPNTCWSYN